VFYEAPHRMRETVADLVELLEPARATSSSPAS
jgi:16S rRNA C1402 (ribose-2'-O) methylase RsmI